MFGVGTENCNGGEQGQGFTVRDFGRLLFVLARLTHAAFIYPCWPACLIFLKVLF